MAALTALIIAFCYVWIARDSWLQEAFVVYGRAFRAAVDLKAWDIMYRCGWRLCIVVATICVTIWFALDAMILKGNETAGPTKLVWVILAVLAVAMIPWRFAVVAKQRRHEIDSLANELSGTARRIVSTSDMNTAFIPAGYDNTSEPCRATECATGRIEVRGSTALPIDGGRFMTEIRSEFVL